MASPTQHDNRTAHAVDVLCLRAASHNAQQLERALVRKYITTTHQTVRENKLLLDALQISPDEQSSGVDAALADVEVATIDDLVKAFELLVRSPAAGGGAGSIFTPSPIAAFMVAVVITPDRAAARVVDPACGCGALLVAALHRLYEVNGGTVPASRLIEEQLFGSDIDADSVRRTKLLLSIAALELGSDVPDLSVHVSCFDSLDPRNWAGNSADHSFDVVVGNPPYVRYHELDAAYRKALPARWSVLGHGNYNLYYAFFELAEHLRAPGGAVAYITPSAYFQASSAAPLREWMIAKQFPTNVVDFGHATVFPGVMTYTAITFSDGKSDSLSYFRCSSAAELSELPLAGGSIFAHAGLGSEPWSLVGATHQRAVCKLASAGRSLLEVADIRYGLATLRDKLYLLDGSISGGCYTKKWAGNTFLIEPSATRPVVRVSGTSDQQALDSALTRILFPYKVNAGRVTVWSEEELAEYPGAHAYFTAIAGELARRDRGKKAYANWFAYGRTQGLTVNHPPRLLTPLYASRPRFLVDRKPDRLFLNGCSLTPRQGSGVSLDLLAVVLNSAVLHYFIEQTSRPITGGFYAYQKGPLGSFHIPDSVLEAEDEALASSWPDRNLLLADLYGVDLPATYA